MADNFILASYNFGNSIYLKPHKNNHLILEKTKIFRSTNPVMALEIGHTIQPNRNSADVAGHRTTYTKGSI